jgi:CRISPR-associated protein Cas2
MTVLVANDTPPAIRGHLKRWFIEPSPNVFVGTMNVRTYQKVSEFVLRNAGPDFGMLAITSAPNCQGYSIKRIGPVGKVGRKEVNLSGIPLIAESWVNPENMPF